MKNRAMKEFSFLLGLILLSLPLVYSERQYEAPRVFLQSSQQVFAEAGEVYAVVYSDHVKQFYVLGGKFGMFERTVFIYDNRHRLLRKVSVGNAKEARDIAVDRSGRIYLAGDQLAKVFDRQGRMIKSFPVSLAESIALLSDGRIVIGAPTDDGLVHLYSLEGRKLASFGKMKELDAYAPENRWLNRGKVVVGPGDEIYYVFKDSPEPSVMKFSPEGNLLLEFAITGEAIDLHTEPARRFLSSKQRNTVGGFHIINSAGTQLGSGQIWIVFNGSTRGGVAYEYSPEGRKVREYNLTVDSNRVLSSANGICVTKEAIYVITQHGQVYLFDPAKSLRGNEVNLAVQQLCPSETSIPDCTRNCGGPIVKDCKAELQQHISTGEFIKIVDPVGCQTDPDNKRGCKASATTCDWRDGNKASHSTTLICQDGDGDGYYEGEDCVDTDPGVNPGEWEGPIETYQCDLCWDTKDNECDGATDLSDYDCFFGGACGGSPIVIDTQGNDFRLVGLSAGVQFDLLGNGQPIRVGWIQGDDALLALDRNGNGVIDNGHELFGNVTRLPSGRHAENGYQALAEFDSNGDQVIDARDSVFPSLRLWLDGNVKGVTERGELATLAQHQITAIELDYRESRRRDQHGNEFRYRAKVHRAGPTTNRFCYDVIFVTR